MPEVTEAPITEKDLTALVEPSVALPAAKLRELLEYVGQLEDALKCTEFDLGREREFSGLLRSCLIESNEELGQFSPKTLFFFKKWGALLNDLLEQGSIGDEQVERFQEILNRIRSIGGQGAAGAASAHHSAHQTVTAEAAPAERAYAEEHITVREVDLATYGAAAAAEASAAGESQDDVASSAQATTATED
ncbi:MAG: hypothetical protein QOC96_3293 [Acidobacteriota bacterium]|jgi:hypothetical protein|nr:hypothetical protein [Acidobacteriota bacterium]